MGPNIKFCIDRSTGYIGDINFDGRYEISLIFNGNFTRYRQYKWNLFCKYLTEGFVIWIKPYMFNIVESGHRDTWTKW